MRAERPAGAWRDPAVEPADPAPFAAAFLSAAFTADPFAMDLPPVEWSM
jgi:hypothetical protein